MVEAINQTAENNGFVPKTIVFCRFVYHLSTDSLQDNIATSIESGTFAASFLGLVLFIMTSFHAFFPPPLYKLCLLVLTISLLFCSVPLLLDGFSDELKHIVLRKR